MTTCNTILVDLRNAGPLTAFWPTAGLDHATTLGNGARQRPRGNANICAIAGPKR